MDNQNEKDIKGQSNSEGQSPKDDIPLWLQGLEDPNLEDTNPIYPESDVEDKWIKELSGESPENGEAFSSLEDDIRSDNVLPDWLSELSKVDPSPPEIFEKQEDETDPNPTAEYSEHSEERVDDKTEEIEIEQMLSEGIVDSEGGDFEDGFVEISDVNLMESSQSEEVAGNTMAAEETLPYWLRDMIAEPPKPAPIEEPNTTMEAEGQLAQDEPKQPLETESEAPSQQGLEPKMMDGDGGSGQNSEFFGEEHKPEVSLDSPQIDKTRDGEAVHSAPDLAAETLEAEGVEVEVAEAELNEIEATTTSLGTPGSDLPAQSDEITKPIKVNLEEPFEEPEQVNEESEEITTKEKQDVSEEEEPANIGEQQQASTDIETLDDQKQHEDAEEPQADETDGQLGETAKITTNKVEAALEKPEVSGETEEKELLEEPAIVSITKDMIIEEQLNHITPPDPDTRMEEGLLSEGELTEADSSLAPEVFETEMEGPPEHEVPMTLDDEETETIMLPQSDPEMEENLPIIDKQEQVHPLEMPKTLLFARYLLEQGDTESATQILEPFIERAEHLDDIETWLLESANDAARSSSFVWEMIGDIALVQDDPNRAFESYSKAINLLLQTKKDFDETH